MNTKEEKLKCKEYLFQFKQKIKTIEDKLIIRIHETPLTRADYESAAQKLKELEAELAELEKETDKK